MTINDLFTLALAVYGAVLATILGIRELQRDKRRIGVILEYVAFYERAQIVITNIGHRPITIAEIRMEAGVKQNGKLYWEGVPRNTLFAEAAKDHPLPIILDDGEYLALPLSTEIGKIFLEDKTRVRVFVYDVDGNVYKKFRTRFYNPKWGNYSKMGT